MSASLSLIVILHNMPEQAWNSLLSLTADYQKGVSSTEYEVIVVENSSGNNIPPHRIKQLPENFKYVLREEPGVSPAPAINHALTLCRGENIGLLIDGAYVLTPGVLTYALQALRLYKAVVAVPGYYLSQQGKDGGIGSSIVEYEQNLLRSIHWKTQGYSLFREATFNPGNRNGQFHPFMESNAFFFPKAAINERTVDESFALPGGGSLNLHIFRQLCLSLETAPVILMGEGCFHQYHGGVSTSNNSERDERVKTFKQQLNTYWSGGFKAVTREPLFFGHISQEALPFVQHSIEAGERRFSRLKSSAKPVWEDDRSIGVNNGETIEEP
ncbi:glycosyltransferase [Ketobacter sp.]